MDAIYLISLIVGGFFVLLSMLGGDSDVEADFDGDIDLEHDLGGHGFVDLLSIRTLFLFAAFFGLTGVLLGFTDAGEAFRATVSILTGLVSGLGGSYLIKTIGYRNVSSAVSLDDLKGQTAKVVIPFSVGDRGKIALVARGNHIMLSARSFDPDTTATFATGDEVVVIGLEGHTAEVVRPD